MTLWDNYTEAESTEGQLMTKDSKCHSKVAEGAIRNGLLVLQGTSDQQVMLPEANPTADADSIAIDVPAAVTISILDTVAELDGTIGPSKMSPSRQLTFTFDASTDWDVAAGFTIDVYAYGPSGQQQHEQLVKATGGGAETLTSRFFTSQVSLVELGAASAATGGLLDIGTSATQAIGSLDAVGIAAYDRGNAPASTVGYDYDDEGTLPVCVDGIVACTVEATLAVDVEIDDPVYVRTTAAGADIRGQLSGPTVDANFSRVDGLKWVSDTSAGDLGKVQVRY